MLEHIITGGQTGVEQAAWRVAKRWGYKTSGMMPKEFRTEDGFRPEFELTYGAKDSRSAGRNASIQRNALDSEAVLWLGPTSVVNSMEKSGFPAVYSACSHTRTGIGHSIEHSMSRRLIVIDDMERRLKEVCATASTTELLLSLNTGYTAACPSALSMLPIRDILMGMTTVCIAGLQESDQPGIGDLTERFLETVFHMIRDKVSWDIKEYGRNLALRGLIFEEGPIEEPLEENLDEIPISREQLEKEFKEAASHRVSPPLALPPGWLPGESL